MPTHVPPEAPALVWFRDDLRLGDNPALHAAVQSGRPVLCLFVLDEESPGLRPHGGASRWWLHHSLMSLAESLREAGGRLFLLKGAATETVTAVAAQAKAGACFWNRRYGAAERAVDEGVEKRLAAAGIAVETFNGRLLHEPGTVRSKTGGAFKVFTPFLRASLALGSPGRPLPAPRAIQAPDIQTPKGHLSVEAFELLPRKPDWAGGLRETWTPGETAARKALHDFLHGGLVAYGEDRNQPALAATSRLSPHLHFGEISPRQVMAQARHAADAGLAAASQVDKFLSELIWRDFAHSLLHDHPDLARQPVQPAFRHFPYRTKDEPALSAWQKGLTGYPIVDAGMRELWQTGVMHNRVRMIVASFLVKHLLLDWRCGEAWFWDTLCDADGANNPMNWQWVAGCGVDPSPYFRIFNPTLQGEKFDTKGDYVRRFVPELDDMPAKWIHRPWDAPPDVLAKAGVRLGGTYPQPIVDHDLARDRALKALTDMRRLAS